MRGRKPKFKSWLAVYCQYLTDSPDFRLANFSRGLNENYRAQEPVLVYALLLKRANFAEQFDSALVDKWNKLRYACQKYDNNVESMFENAYLRYESLKKEFGDSSEVEDLLDECCGLSYDFLKVYYAYKGEVEFRAADRELKKRYAKRLNQLLDEKKCTKFQVSKSTGVDLRNLHSFLNGEYGRLSDDKCAQVFRYLSTL